MNPVAMIPKHTVKVIDRTRISPVGRSMNLRLIPPVCVT